ncbi:Imm10 family immunity protein [Lentzea sp. NPDC042327]|uniref:Imm10 family immunity protein n=1 Tax=Lentzea sp. NPDC042327 TaxID=3154801 RepID=UPI0033F9D8CC
MSHSTLALRAVEAGYFEDHEDEEAIEVALTGLDESGLRRSFSFQRSSYDEPDEQDVEVGLDSYCVVTERGRTCYGCLTAVGFGTARLTLDFTAEDAAALDIATRVELDLSGVDQDVLAEKLCNVLDWGAQAKRPAIVVTP